MIRSHLLWAVLVLFSLNCYPQGNLSAQKSQIDTFILKNNIKPIILAKTTDKTALFEFDGIEYPPYMEYSYYIYKDASGKIVKISESPYNENGEWSVFLSHYFNQSGNTFAFERVSTFFSIICSEGVATHTQAEFYSDNFQLQNKEYKFIDEFLKDLAKDNCELPVNTEYVVYKDVSEYMNKKNIKLTR